MTDPLATITTRRTPGTVQAHPDEVPNSGGGYGFLISPMAQLGRFLILGTEGGTYYTSEREMTRDVAGGVMLDLARTGGLEVVNEIVDVSTAGRAPRNDQALFMLAATLGLNESVQVRRAAADALPKVARTGTHLFQFVGYLEQFRGWGKLARRAVASWYEQKPAGQLAYQAIKYQRRGGWSHWDLLRLSHPGHGMPQAPDMAPPSAAQRAVFEYIARGTMGAELPALIWGVQAAHQPGADVAAVVAAYPGLPWEALPAESLKRGDVWEALIGAKLPVTAMLRNLARLTANGVLTRPGAARDKVLATLQDAEALTAARVHPLSVLVAARTYASGEGLRGKLSWQPEADVLDALDAAFYNSFGAVRRTGRRIMLAVDVSASMTWQTIAGLPITPMEAVGALALVTKAVEGPNATIMGFSAGLEPLPISARQRLDDVARTMRTYHQRASYTDASLPMLYGIQERRGFDAFVALTDNETNDGQMHPWQALQAYRQQVVPDARLAVVGCTSTRFSIANPADRGTLDVVGFDTATPNLLADFVAGDI